MSGAKTGTANPAHVHGHRGTNRKGKETRSPTYNSWRSMLELCYRERHPRYQRYGGRGIEVCDRWRHGEGGMGAFLCFLEDMGTRPSLEHSLERIDKDGPYVRHLPDGRAQCTWVTIDVQNANRSNTRLVEFRGAMMTVRSAHNLANCTIPFGSVLNRVQRGWDVSMAMATPLKKKAANAKKRAKA